MELSVRRPWMPSRCIQDLAPFGETRRYSPCSSTSFAGPFAASILHTVSLATLVPQLAP